MLANLAPRQRELKTRLLLERRGLSPAARKEVLKRVRGLAPAELDEIAYQVMLRTLKRARGLKRMRGREPGPRPRRTPLA